MKSLFLHSRLMLLVTLLLGCGGGGSEDESKSGPVLPVIEENAIVVLAQRSKDHHLSELDDGLLLAAINHSVRYQLILGGRLFNQHQINSEGAMFETDGFVHAETRAFELKMYAADTEDSLLLSATGTHTFDILEKTQTPECVEIDRNGTIKCSIPPSDPVEPQQLVFDQITLARCNNDPTSTLSKVQQGLEPCALAPDTATDYIAVSDLLTPTSGQTVERSASYKFEFTTTEDLEHTFYFVRLFADGNNENYIYESPAHAVLGYNNAPYTITTSVDLRVDRDYQWAVFGFKPGRGYLRLSAIRSFTVARAVPTLAIRSPSDGDTLAYATAETGHAFRFNSSTDTGVSEYRVHLVDQTNDINYGYKRIASNINANGGNYTVTRNLALKHAAHHQWSITANDSNGTVLAKTETRDFHIEPAERINYTLTLDTPRDGAVLEKVSASAGYQFNFSSGENSGISEYRVYLRNTTDDTNYGYKRIGQNGDMNYSTVRNQDLNIGDTYAWYVTANSSDASDSEQIIVSETHSFSLEQPSAGNSDSTIPSLSLTLPAADADVPWASQPTGYGFSFTATDDESVSYYYLYVSDLTTPKNFRYQQIDAAAHTDGGVVRTTRNINTNSDALHEWYVVAYNAAGTELMRTDKQRFNIVVPIITLDSPTHNSSIALRDNNYEFSFTSSSDAGVNEYRVIVVEQNDNPEDDDLRFGYKTISPNAVDGQQSYTTTRRIPLIGGTSFIWRVGAYDARGYEMSTSSGNLVEVLP